VWAVWPLPSNRPVTVSEPVGELSGIGIRRVFPDEMAAFEEHMTAGRCFASSSPFLSSIAKRSIEP
jgi:hypothetical protein